MIPQLFHIIIALSSGRVDDLPFFAGEDVQQQQTAGPTTATGTTAAAAVAAYGKFMEEEKTTMKITTNMKLPPGTYTIEDGIH